MQQTGCQGMATRFYLMVFSNKLINIWVWSCYVKYHSGIIHSTLVWALYDNPFMIFCVAWPHPNIKYIAYIHEPGVQNNQEAKLATSSLKKLDDRTNFALRIISAPMHYLRCSTAHVEDTA